ncbi:hypothetical protein [Achromobacter sp. AGC39]
MLNRNIDRISAQKDLRHLAVLLAANTSKQDQLTRERDRLVREFDEPFKFDRLPISSERDEAGWQELKNMRFR